MLCLLVVFRLRYSIAERCGLEKPYGGAEIFQRKTGGNTQCSGQLSANSEYLSKCVVRIIVRWRESRNTNTTTKLGPGSIQFNNNITFTAQRTVKANIDMITKAQQFNALAEYYQFRLKSSLRLASLRSRRCRSHRLKCPESLAAW